METHAEIRAKLEIIQKWSNEELVAELRNPMRALCSQDVYVPLLVEAVARLLERKREPVKVRTIRNPLSAIKGKR